MREVPNWDEYFMRIAVTASLRSKDPNTQVGSVVVDKNNHIIGTGYNGMPPGMKELEQYWEESHKYNMVIHSEANSIIHSSQSTQNCKIYTTMFPCINCAKIIVSAGIKKVYYNEFREEFRNSYDFLLNVFDFESIIKVDI